MINRKNARTFKKCCLRKRRKRETDKKARKRCIKNGELNDDDHRDIEKERGGGREGRRKRERDGVCVRRRLFRSSFFSFFKQMTPISKPIFESIYHYMICCSTMGFIFSSCYIRTHAHVTHLNDDKAIIVDVN